MPWVLNRNKMLFSESRDENKEDKKAEKGIANF